MRLINVETLQFKEFHESQIPQYAILSHTWEDGEEMTYQDMMAASRPSKPGYGKIIETCRLARHEKLEYAWVDTCCIDKSSSAELTESINSMYRWYQNATICFVHLSDLSPEWKALGFEEALWQCRWTTRGWTLQELIAPRNIDFYDANWHRVCSKGDISAELSRVTLIPYNVLSGKKDLDQYSIAMKMSWASRRETTRPEDTAYCLLGIFDINMPLVYGEGSRAFFRLQEEIVRHSNDLSIFAWDSKSPGAEFCSAFAPSPAAFVGSKNIYSLSKSFQNPDFTITNKGLRLDAPLLLLQHLGLVDYYLLVGSKEGASPDGGASLVAVPLRVAGANVLVRPAVSTLDIQAKGVFYDVTKGSTFYVDVKPSKPPAYYRQLLRQFRFRAIYVAAQLPYYLYSCSPVTLWDPHDGCFFGSQSFSIVYSGIAKLTIDDVVVHLWFMFHSKIEVRNPVIVNFHDCKALAQQLYRHTGGMDFLEWSDLAREFPIIATLSDKTRVSVNGRAFLVTATITPRSDQSYVLEIRASPENDTQKLPPS